MTDVPGASSRLVSCAVIAAIAAGALATAYGLYHLALPDAQGPAWRCGLRYTLILLPLMLLAVLAGLWRGPRMGGALVAGLLLLLLGVAVQALAVAVFAASALTLGNWLLRGDAFHPLDKLLVGLTVFGTFFGLLAHFSVNSAGLWDALIALPPLLGWRYLRDACRGLGRWLVERPDGGFGLRMLQAAIVAAASLHLLGALMPEVGHDALATHLFVPEYLAQHRSWSFDARTYSWAVMPMLVEWIYSAGYFLAGSLGAHLINAAAVMLLAELVHRVSRWAGAGPRQAAWGALLLLLTPLVFAESSSLFIDVLWSTLLLAGTLALLRMLAQPERARSEIVLGGVLLGGALAAKAVTFTALPVLALVLLLAWKRWFRVELLPVLALGLGVFVAIGSVPYLTAWWKTGNPVFPFFNAVFHSPLYPTHDIAPPPIFARGLRWDTPYRMTFDSSRYLEGTAGAAGFQWLLLVLPAGFAAALARHRRALLLFLIAASWMWLVFHETAYLRYALPSFALGGALIALLLNMAASAGPWASRAALVAAMAVAVLDLLHFSSGTYYGTIDFRVLTDSRAKDEYVLQKAPVRDAVAMVNALDPQGTPVAFFCDGLAAGLHGNALYPNWYNPTFLAAIKTAHDAAALGRVLAHNNVEYLLLDGNWERTATGARLLKASTEVANVGGISVRRLDDRFRFGRELLPSTDIGKGWQLMAGVVKSPGGGVLVTAASPAYAAVPIQPDRVYRYEAVARCSAGPAMGRLQVNWMGSRGQFIRSSIRTFVCQRQATDYKMEVVAPRGAVVAVVYASGQSGPPILFSNVSFRN